MTEGCGVRGHRWESIACVSREDRKCRVCGKNAMENFEEATRGRGALFVPESVERGER